MARREKNQANFDAPRKGRSPQESAGTLGSAREDESTQYRRSGKLRTTVDSCEKQGLTSQFDPILELNPRPHVFYCGEYHIYSTRMMR